MKKHTRRDLSNPGTTVSGAFYFILIFSFYLVVPEKVQKTIVYGNCKAYLAAENAGNIWKILKTW